MADLSIAPAPTSPRSKDENLLRNAPRIGLRRSPRARACVQFESCGRMFKKP
jgi:hypothetical protein